MLSSIGSDLQLFHYDCRVVLLSIQSLSRNVLRRCCSGHESELQKIEGLFLIDWEGVGGWFFKFVPLSNACASHMLHIQLNNKTNGRVQSVKKVIIYGAKLCIRVV